MKRAILVVLVLTLMLLVTEYRVDNLSSQITTASSELDSIGMEVTMLKEKLTPSPDHAISWEDVRNAPEFMSLYWQDREYQFQRTVEEIVRIYYQMHTFIPGETDCNDMAVDLWNMFLTERIKSVIVLGNLDISYAEFSKCNHVWLIVFNAEGEYMVVDPPTGEVFYKPIPECYKKFSFVYKKPSNLWSDLKKKW